MGGLRLVVPAGQRVRVSSVARDRLRDRRLPHRGEKLLQVGKRVAPLAARGPVDRDQALVRPFAKRRGADPEQVGGFAHAEESLYRGFLFHLSSRLVDPPKSGGNLHRPAVLGRPGQTRKAPTATAQEMCKFRRPNLRQAAQPAQIGPELAGAAAAPLARHRPGDHELPRIPSGRRMGNQRIGRRAAAAAARGWPELLDLGRATRLRRATTRWPRRGPRRARGLRRGR